MSSLGQRSTLFQKYLRYGTAIYTDVDQPKIQSKASRSKAILLPKRSFDNFLSDTVDRQTNQEKTQATPCRK